MRALWRGSARREVTARPRLQVPMIERDESSRVPNSPSPSRLHAADLLHPALLRARLRRRGADAEARYRTRRGFLARELRHKLDARRMLRRAVAAASRALRQRRACVARRFHRFPLLRRPGLHLSGAEPRRCLGGHPGARLESHLRRAFLGDARRRGSHAHHVDRRRAHRRGHRAPRLGRRGEESRRDPPEPALRFLRGSVFCLHRRAPAALGAAVGFSITT